MPLILLLLVGVIAISLGWLWIVHPAVLRRRDQIRKAAQQRAPVSELLAKAKEAVLFEGWQKFETGKRVLSLDESCSGSVLHASLEALWAEVCEEDQREGRSGRDSNFFELYDCGIVAIIMELERRAGHTSGPLWKEQR